MHGEGRQWLREMLLRHVDTLLRPTLDSIYVCVEILTLKTNS